MTGAPASPAASPGKLRAGAATANITPPLGCSMAGGMTDRRATDIHDELWVRALVLDDGKTRIALAIVDSCAVPRTIIDSAKQLLAASAGIPAANVLIAATHTHTAPPATHLFQSEPDPRYTDWLTQRIADAVRMACARLQPARIGWGVGREERLVFNRRYAMRPGTIPPNPFGETDKVQMNPPAGSENILRPAGPTDPDVGVLAVQSLDGRPLAVLGNYALHYVGGTAPGQISADYFGMWASAMTRLAGGSRAADFPPFVAMLTNACSGNINGVNFQRKAPPARPYELMEAMPGHSRRRANALWARSSFTIPWSWPPPSRNWSWVCGAPARYNSRPRATCWPPPDRGRRSGTPTARNCTRARPYCSTAITRPR